MEEILASGVVITGSLAVTGNWSVTVNNATADATLSTASALTLTPTCASRVTAGSLVAVLGVSARKAYSTWAFARAWLFRALGGDAPAEG